MRNFFKSLYLPKIVGIKGKHSSRIQSVAQRHNIPVLKISTKEKTASYRICQLAGWGIYAMACLAFGLVLGGIYYTTLFKAVLQFIICGLITTHFMRMLLLKMQVFKKPTSIQIGYFFSVTFLFSILLVLLFYFIELTFGFYQISMNMYRIFFIRTSIAYISLLIWNLIYFTYHYIEKSRIEQIEKITLANAMQVQQLGSEKKQAELEMQALRAQMNPHFIFNCLNAINHFILNNEPDPASDYLSKFSKLIRMVLQLSQKDQISLQDELDALHLYIQLEQLRFQEHFQYTISCANCIDPEGIKLPPLLLQPFVENAIWHGLMHKKTPGNLHIDLTLQDSLLHCTITDNGIGRGEAATRQYLAHAPKKSLGMQLTASRLQLLNKGKEEDFFFKIIDLKHAGGESAGTRVIITIPVQLFKNPIPKTNV